MFMNVSFSIVFERDDRTGHVMCMVMIMGIRGDVSDGVRAKQSTEFWVQPHCFRFSRATNVMVKTDDLVR
jgi:hypothetical protein